MLEQMYGLNKLKDVLKNNGIKQIFVAEKIGASKQEISKFVGGKAALSTRKYESLLEWLKNYNMSDEERLKLKEEYYRRKHKPLTKAQIMECELERLEFMNKIKSEPSELETLRTENAILKKKLEEIKSIICGE